MVSDWIQWLARLVGVTLFGAQASVGVKCAFAFFSALMLALLLTPVFRGLMRRLGMIDQPDARRINQNPTPRGGGVSVFIAFHLALLALFLLDGGPVSEEFSVSWYRAFFIGSLVLAVIGVIDDKFGMKPLVKLLGQVAVASFLFFSGIRLHGIFVSFPDWLDYAVTVFWIVGAVNAFNLIDGMDGLASGLALIASIGLAGSLFFTGCFHNMIPYCALGGACLGFLRYNFHPATVFLGDTGSMFLGLCVATLPLVSGSRLELVPALIVPLLAMGIPIFDTLLTIWRRTVRASLGQQVSRREQIMTADKDHLHHRILRQTMSQRNTAWILYGVSAVLVAIGIIGMLSKKRAPGVFLIAFFVAVVVIVKHLVRIELWDTGRLLSNRRVTIRKGLIIPLYILFDLTALACAWLLAHWVFYAWIPRHLFTTSMPLHVGTVFISLVLTKTYRRVWQRAQFGDFSLLIGAIVIGVVVGAGLIRVVYDLPESIWETSLLLGAFSLPPLIAARLASESFRGVMQELKRHALLQRKTAPRLLVYGAGLRFRSYMREQTLHLDDDSGGVIVGIIDDDLHLVERVIYGYDVLGGLNDIPEICQAQRVDRVVVTCVLDAEHQEALLRMAQEQGFRVSVWVTEERGLS